MNESDQQRVELAKILRTPLPQYIEVVCDLCADRAALASGIADDTTSHILVSDEQAHQSIKVDGRPSYASLEVTRITGALDEVYGLMREVRWQADLFVSQPPAGLVERAKWVALAESECLKVRQMWAVSTPETAKGLIDSTLLAWLIALDRLSERGEGLFLLSGDSKEAFERLVLAPGGAYAGLKSHLWLLVADLPLREPINDFKSKSATVVYWAKSHDEGPQMSVKFVQDADDLLKRLRVAQEVRFRIRRGPALIYSGTGVKDSARQFGAIKDELTQRKKATRADYNLSLDGDSLKCSLSLFDQYREQAAINKRDVEQLWTLHGATIPALVPQVAMRQLLQRTIAEGGWRIDPAITPALDRAIAEYHAAKAPLYPLPDAQRVGYLDECEWITCKASLSAGRGAFVEGKRYKIRTAAVLIERSITRTNMAGEPESILQSGQEMVLYIQGEDGLEHSFIDSRFRKPEIAVTRVGGSERLQIEFGMEVLLEHFEIPQAPDVAMVNPEGYKQALAEIDRIQAFINEFIDPQFRFKKFQREDWARLVLHDGSILAWDMGCGKTLAAAIYPLLKVGVDWEASRKTRGLVPMKPVLLVAPEALHRRTCKDWAAKFGIATTHLDSQDTYLEMTRNGLKPLAPGWYISSYQELGLNGRDKLPVPAKCEKTFPAVAQLMHFYGVDLETAKAQDVQASPGENPLIAKALAACEARYEHFSQGVGEFRNGIKCIFGASLADLCGRDFADGCVVLDEGVRIQSEDGIISRAIRELNPRFRLVMSGTPIRNRLRQIFWLGHWAAGGKDKAHARFPYSSESDQQDLFASRMQVCERNLTREAQARKGKKPVARRKKPRGTPGTQVCNIHAAWKLLAPLVLRRTKENTGEKIVAKNKHLIRVPMGKDQYSCYRYHLLGQYLDKYGDAAIMSKLQALRAVAACPNGESLKQLPPELEGERNGLYRSSKDYTPKLSAALNIIAQHMAQGDQVTVFSGLHEPLDTLSARLNEVGIPHDVLDGRRSAEWRAEKAEGFEKGLQGGGNPVMLAGMKAMGEGLSFPLCRVLVIIAYEWSADIIRQCVDRVHRLTSKRDVEIYTIICDGSVECRMVENIGEKNTATDLVIDGQAFTAEADEMSLWDVLKEAEAQFRSAKFVPEDALEQEWVGLKAKLRQSWQACRTGKITPTTSQLMQRIKQLQVAA